MEMKVKIPLKNGKTREVVAEFLKIELGELIPYRHNSKRHPQEQIEQIKDSIQHTGFRSPIEIDEKNIILAGHGRLEACKQLGIKEVLVIKYSDLSRGEKISYRNNTNRIADFGSYDLDLLQMDLGSIELENYESEMFDFAIPTIEIGESKINTEISSDMDNDIDPNINGASKHTPSKAEDTERIEGNFVESQELDTKQDQKRCIQVAIEADKYDETFEIYRKLLDSGVNIGEILLKGLKNYSK